MVYLGKPMVKTRKTHGLPGKTHGKNSENPWFTWENPWFTWENDLHMVVLTLGY